MKCTVELSPSGDLIFTSPTGREILLPFALAVTDVPWPDPENDLANIWKKRALQAEAAHHFIRTMLLHAEEHPETKMAYPTQHVADAFRAGKRIDWTKPEPTVVRTILGDAPSGRKSKPLNKKEKKAALRKQGLPDLSTLEFEL